MQPLQPGDPRTVGPYALIARLGSGGMGHVFLGRTRGGRTVAVKAVKPELAGNPEFRRRFRQEVAAARLVSGPHTAPVVDADPEAAMPWLATAYVSGQTLRAAVAAGWRLPEASLLVLAGGLARALGEIHAAGVVHRDLKPSNVMLAVEGPRVIDFGISRVTAAADYTRTDVGTIVGSPGFMSPEQSRGQSLTGTTDVFSLGTVLAYAATGHNPFGDGPDHALLYRIGHAEPNVGGIPDRLVPLVRACLEKDPARRPTTAQIIQHTAAAPEGPWLPAALTAAIAQDAAEILDYEGVAVFPERDVPTGNGRHAAGNGRHAAAGGPADSGTRQTRIEGPVPETLVLPPDQVPGPRRSERVAGGGGVPGEPPMNTRGERGGRDGRRERGAGGAGWVVGVLAVAVIAALSTALVLVLHSGEHHPAVPPAASVSGGAGTSPSPLPRSAHSTSPVRTPVSSAPSPTATSNSVAPTAPSSAQTTAVSSPSSTTSGSSPSTTPSSAPSSTPSSTPSSSPPTTPNSSASHSAPPPAASSSSAGGAALRKP